MCDQRNWIVDHCTASRKTNVHCDISIYEQHNQVFQLVHKVHMALQQSHEWHLIIKCCTRNTCLHTNWTRHTKSCSPVPNAKPQAQQSQSSSHQEKSKHRLQPTRPFPDLHIFRHKNISVLIPVEKELTQAQQYITCKVMEPKYFTGT